MAVITVLGASAIAAADRCDQADDTDVKARPLHGWPIAVKDNIEVAGTRTTSGSPIFTRHVATRDAAVITRLREAGAVFIAKTNLSELAIGPTTQNPTYGNCRNPWNTTRIPAGSSGGSAVAVATGMCRAALGTDTGGSVRLPAAAVGIVGLRPTTGAIPTVGVTPLLTRFDTVGPLARSVADLEKVFSVLCDRRGSMGEVTVPTSLTGTRIGVPDQFFFEHLPDDISDAARKALASLEALGATLVDIHLTGADEAREQFENVAGPEAYVALRDHLRTTPTLLAPSIRERLERASNIPAPSYLDGLRWQRSWQRQVESALEECDLIVSPAMASTPPRLDEASEPRQIEALTRFGYPWSLVPGPTLTMPCGQTHDGMPIGLQATARADDEDRLFRIGTAYQSVTDWHQLRPPTQTRRAATTTVRS